MTFVVTHTHTNYCKLTWIIINCIYLILMDYVDFICEKYLIDLYSFYMKFELIWFKWFFSPLFYYLLYLFKIIKSNTLNIRRLKTFRPIYTRKINGFHCTLYANTLFSFVAVIISVTKKLTKKKTLLIYFHFKQNLSSMFSSSLNYSFKLNNFHFHFI